MITLERRIQAAIENEAALGAAIAIVQHGRVTYLGGFGTTSVEAHGTAVTPQTLFAYGSICKNLCAALIMRLAEAGLLALDEPVGTYLPDLRWSNADDGRRVTLRHLLSHTSGLPMGGKYWGPRDPDSLRRFVYEQIPYYQFLSAPGTVHLYSNTVFCIAGHVTEVVTGRYYDDLIQEYVFTPLNMRHVTFDPTVAMTYPLALPHERDPDGVLRTLHRMTYNVSGNPSSFAYGSVVDLANLAQMYLNEGTYGEGRFLTTESLTDMWRVHADICIESAAMAWAHTNGGYGLGFNIGRYHGRRVARHGGMNLSYNCFFDLFPDDHAGVVVLTNYCDDWKLLELIMALYDEALEQPSAGAVFVPPPPHATPPDPEQLRGCCGTFLQIETATPATIRLETTTLVLEWNNAVHPLIPIGGNRFYADISAQSRISVAVLHNTDGQLSHVMIDGAPYHPFAIAPIPQPDLQRWAAFAGIYKDPSNSNRAEILTVRLHNGAVHIAENTHEVACTPIGDASFLSELGLFEFEPANTDSEIHILVWGKAVRYYPVDAQAYRTRRVIVYLADIPTVAQRSD